MKEVEEATRKDELFARAQAKAIEIKATRVIQDKLSSDDCIVYGSLSSYRTRSGLMKDMDRPRRNWLARLFRRER